MILQEPSDNNPKCFTVKPLLLSLFLAFLVTGCATNPDNRLVGKLTYDQAVGQFGHPKSKEIFSDGGVRATWVAIAVGLTVTVDAQGSLGFHVDNPRDWTRKNVVAIMCLLGREGAVPPPQGGQASKGTFVRYRILSFGADKILLNAEKKDEITYNK